MQSSLEKTDIEVKSAQHVNRILVAVTIILALVCAVLSLSVLSLTNRVNALEGRNPAEEEVSDISSAAEADSENEDNIFFGGEREVVPESERGYLGITVTTVTEEMAKEYNMPQGVYVMSIENGSMAASGLSKGDIITGINNAEITSVEDLHAVLSYYREGDEVTVNGFRLGDADKYNAAFSVNILLIGEQQLSM